MTGKDTGIGILLIVRNNDENTDDKTNLSN